MKSIKEMQKVVIALTMITHKPAGSTNEPTEEEKKAARQAMDILFWVMDYPNNFSDFAEPVIKACPVTNDNVDKVFAEAMEAHGEEKGIINE